eukprot:TRINITY_DN3638_c0_g1_i14.p1 TRINITY_DN3638_c0_g1~~TRINITY_DN3638_c0_g1_i14.p1  ORF type:complete len:412 (+),score=81.59 TRINITY_DN3638_c0_g1_i14:1794-3029(+)
MREVSGGLTSDPISKWTDLSSSVDDYLLANMEKMGFTRPSPVQSQVIPSMIERNEILCAAPTGSGKTIAYLVPLFQIMREPNKLTGPRAIIVLPTRELALQVETEAKRLSSGKDFFICLLTKVTGKTLNKKDDGGNSVQNADLVITTPTRLLALVKGGKVDLHSVHNLVLDEADKLLDDSFLSEMDVVISACSNSKLLVCMFSATFHPSIEELAKTVMKAPLRISVGTENTTVETVKQKLTYCGDERGKVIAIQDRLRSGIKPPVLIFVQTKERANALYKELMYDNINVDVISADRTPEERETTVMRFKQGKVWFLIATDLVARGLDFEGINLVLNYDMPASPNDYIHRVGRTGRMGREGTAETFYTDEDVPFLRSIVNVLKNSGQPVPSWLANFQATSRVMGRIRKLNQV